MKRKSKVQPVQLTSLLDLLFMMVFISLLQVKAPTEAAPELPQTPTESASVPTKQLPQQPPSQAKATKINISAHFQFFATPTNPKAAQGSFAMVGMYNTQTGTLNLVGTEWTDRPEGYDMVPLNGKIAPGSDIFFGSIDAPNCTEFKLNRVQMGSGKHINGEWSGTYNCSQGETGLKLIITSKEDQ